MRLRKAAATVLVSVAGTFALLGGTAVHAASATTETTVASAPVDTVAAETGATEATTESGTESGTEAGGKAELAKPEQECLEILEKGGKVSECVEAPNPILPAGDEILWGTIAFLAILGMLWKFALPAIRKTMAARTAKIEGDLKAAESAKADAAKVVADYNAKIGDAKSEGERIREEARTQAESIRKDIIARAEADAEAIRTKAADDTSSQVARAKADLESHVKSLSLDLAEKVVGANMNRDTNSALVDRYIAELGSK